MARRDNILRAFGAAVRQRREAQGFSQEGFAAKAGIDRSYMGGIERGQRNPTLLNICRIAVALGVSPSDLLGSVRQ